jgi:hypothetical protein
VCSQEFFEVVCILSLAEVGGADMHREVRLLNDQVLGMQKALVMRSTRQLELKFRTDFLVLLTHNAPNNAQIHNKMSMLG